VSDLFITVFPEIIGFLKAQKGAAFLTSEGDLVLSCSSGLSKESAEGLKRLQIEDDAISWCAKNNSPRVANSFSESEKRLVNLIGDEQAKSLICAPLSFRKRNLGVLAVFGQDEFTKEDLLVLSSVGNKMGEMIQYLNRDAEIRIQSEKLDSVEKQRKLLFDLLAAVSESKTEKILDRLVWTGAQMIHSDSCKIMEIDTENKTAAILTSSDSAQEGKKMDISESAEIKEVVEKREIVFKTFKATERGMKSFLALPLFVQDKTLGALVFEFREYSPSSTEVEIDLAKTLASLASFVLSHQSLSESIERQKGLPLTSEILDQLSSDLLNISGKTQLLLKQIQSSKIDSHIIPEELKKVEQLATKMSQNIREIQGQPRLEEKISREEKEEIRPEGLRILAIDDQKVIRDILEDLSRSLGYQIELASDGEEGLRIFEKDNFDIVITESVMPRVSGWDVSREVKSLRPGVVVVLITGWEMPPEKKMLQDYGIDFILNKPFRLDQLNHIIQKTREMKK